MPKRVHPHNTEFQRLLHARGMTLKKLALQMDLGKTHVHLCQVVNGRRLGPRTVTKLRHILPEDEWEAVRAFRALHLGAGVDEFVDVPRGTTEGEP
jgi:hypothetical protein